MLAKKKKIGKKQIKEDKLVTFYSKSLQYYDAYQNQIFVGVAVVIVLIGAIVYFGHTSKEKDIEASAAIAKAIQLYEAGNYQAAIEGNPSSNTQGLLQLTDKYGSTESGEIAKVYLGNAYYYEGKYDEALKSYSDYSGDLEAFEAASLAGQACCYESKGDHEKASSLFKEAASVKENNASNPEYLLSAGINFIQSGKYAEAEEVLEKLKKDYPKVTEATEADKYLAQVKLKS